jgi:lambda family phage portal protein
MKTRLYNAWTSLRGSLLAIGNPSKAFAWHAGRDYYRAYVAGELSDADKNFRPRRRSGDADVKRAYAHAIDRCRDQAQNNPLISGAIERVAANVVRSGIYPQFKFRSQDDKLDRLVNTRWKRLFMRWARYCDSTGHGNYASQQRLGLRHLWSDRGFLVHRIWDDSLPGIVPLRLELIECDQLDTRVDGLLENGNVARKGIEHDDRGREVAYHVLKNHPGDYLNFGLLAASERYTADEMFHVWDRRRISQFSGVPWLVAVVMEAYRMEDFRHITQDAARTQASFVAFLQSAYPGFQLGAGLPIGGQATPFKPGETGVKEAPTEIKSNIIQGLPTGTSVQMHAPTQPGAAYEPFVKDSQRWQSAGIGMSFEAFANNYTDSSYASSRSGSLEERLSYRSQQQLIEEQFNRRIIAWFMEGAILSGLAPVRMPGYARDKLLYHEMAEGMFPGWTWVDPRNDAQAAKDGVELTIETRRRLAAHRGNDWDEDIDSLIEEEERLLDLEEIRAKRLALQETNNATTEPTQSGN